MAPVSWIENSAARNRVWLNAVPRVC